MFFQFVFHPRVANCILERHREEVDVDVEVEEMEEVHTTKLISLITFFKRGFHINVTAYESGRRAVFTRDPSDPGGVCWPAERERRLSGLRPPDHLGLGLGGGGTELQEPGGAQGEIPLDSSVSVVMTGPGRSEGENTPPGGSKSGEVGETGTRYTVEEVFLQDAGVQDRPPSDSLVSVVMTDLERR